MENFPNDIKKKKRKRLKIYLWILLVILIISFILKVSQEDNPTIISVVLISLVVLDICFIYLLSEKYFNWPFVSALIYILGMFFKRQHWPLAGTILTIGALFLCLTSLVNALRFQFTMKGNSFLRWFGSISCIIISVYMFGFLVNMQGWSHKVGNTLGYIGISLFILSILGMVFTLPGSNYLNWSPVDRKIFYRSILVPMAIVFTLIMISIVFSDVFIWIMNRGGPPLEINDNIKLYDLEGLVSI